MKKLLLTVLTGAAAASAAWGAVITPSQALERVAGTPVLRSYTLRNGSAMPRLAETRTIDGQPAVYVYEMAGGEGFMVLSADDMAVPLLGYSDEGGFSASDINPEMRWWLDEYAKEIKWLRENPDASGRILHSSKPEKEPIPPLLKTKWDQDTPYNDFCPEIDGELCVTGCVATSMAQIVNYHRLPADYGTGTASVTCNGKLYTFDFSNETFDWDNMLDVYGREGSYNMTQADAVAKLMYACGLSVDMEYGVNASSALSKNVAYALVDHFGFDKGIVIARRNWFGLEEWNDYVYAQLRDYGPVNYSGRTDDSGHSFVCDGYDRDGFFHINWGWGGVSDGYFRLTALDPQSQGIGGSSSGYNLQQSIIANICPPRENSRPEYFMYQDDNLAVTNDRNYVISSVSLGGTFYLYGGFYNGSIVDADVELAYRLDSMDGSAPVYRAVYSRAVSLKPDYGYTSLPVTLPSGLAEGNYRLTPVWRLSGSEEWQDYRMPITSARYISVSISGSTASLSFDRVPRLEAEVTSWDTPSLTGKPIGMTVRLSNTSENEFYGSVVAVLLSSYNDVVSIGSQVAVDLKGGETTDINYTTVFNNIDDNTPLPAGNYTLILCDNWLSPISEDYNITLKTAPAEQGTLSCDRFTFAGDSDAADNMAIEFNAALTCTSGYFVGNVIAWIFEEGETLSTTRLLSGMQYIDQGESADVKFSGALPELEHGHKYRARLHDGDGWILDGSGYSPVIRFTISDPSGIAGIDGAEVVSREYYTLSGTQVSSADLVPGLYIVREHRADGTVRIAKEIRR